MVVYITPYKMASNSAKALAQELKIKRINQEVTRLRGNPNKTIINWGCSSLIEEVEKCNVLNTAKAVATCVNKLSFFEAMKKNDKVNIPEFTTNIEEADAWVREGITVLGRHHLTGSGGTGIYIYDEDNPLLNPHPLYVKYISKKHEFRVHVFNNEPFLVQRKAFNGGIRLPNVKEQHKFKIRNHSNGFVFCRNEDLEIPAEVLSQACVAASSVEGLLFGSVDVIWNEYRKKAYVLEINTASGLTNSTIKDYAHQFRKYLGMEEPKEVKPIEINYPKEVKPIEINYPKGFEKEYAKIIAGDLPEFNFKEV